MRVFVAAELSGGLLDALVETQVALRAHVRGRYVAPDMLHVTLAFLGEIPAHDVGLVGDVVRTALAGTEAPVATLGELGAFGPRRRALLWQAVEGEGLTQLASSVREALDRAGLPYDRKAFRAHVTLMRGADLTGGILPAACPGFDTIEAVCVHRSHLRDDGATYEVLERIPL